MTPRHVTSQGRITLVEWIIFLTLSTMNPFGYVLISGQMQYNVYSDHEAHGKVRQHWRQKKKKAYVRIKRVKSDSYLTYGQSYKTEHYTYTPPPQKKNYK
jgi:hypothetical protein